VTLTTPIEDELKDASYTDLLDFQNSCIRLPVSDRYNERACKQAHAAGQEWIQHVDKYTAPQFNVKYVLTTTSILFDANSKLELIKFNDDASQSPTTTFNTVQDRIAAENDLSKDILQPVGVFNSFEEFKEAAVSRLIVEYSNMFDTTKLLVSRDEGSFATEFNAQTKSINFPKKV
jgi:hypothetical protein